MQTNYTVWRNDKHEDDGMAWQAGCVRTAAESYAEYCHVHGEWTWPHTFLVRDRSTDKVFRVEVDRTAVPVFGSLPPIEVPPGPHDKQGCDCGHPFGDVTPCDAKLCSCTEMCGCTSEPHTCESP